MVRLLVWVLAFWQAGVGSPAGPGWCRVHVERACRATVPEAAGGRRAAALAAIVDRLRGGGATGTITGAAGTGAGADGLLDDGSDGDGSSYAPSSGQALDAASVLAEWDDRYDFTPYGGGGGGSSGGSAGATESSALGQASLRARCALGREGPRFVYW